MDDFVDDRRRTHQIPTNSPVPDALTSSRRTHHDADDYPHQPHRLAPAARARADRNHRPARRPPRADRNVPRLPPGRGFPSRFATLTPGTCASSSTIDEFVAHHRLTHRLSTNRCGSAPLDTMGDRRVAAGLTPSSDDSARRAGPTRRLVGQARARPPASPPPPPSPGEFTAHHRPAPARSRLARPVRGPQPATPMREPRTHHQPPPPHRHHQPPGGPTRRLSAMREVVTTAAPPRELAGPAPLRGSPTQFAGHGPRRRRASRELGGWVGGMTGRVG